MKKPSPKPGRATCGKPELVNSDFTTGGRNMQVISLVTQSERTNQLAADVRDGNADILTLWAAVERFASQQAGRWTRAFRESAGIEESDLMQTAFLALIEALTAWKPERGVFLLPCSISSSNQALQRLAGCEPGETKKTHSTGIVYRLIYRWTLTATVISPLRIRSLILRRRRALKRSRSGKCKMQYVRPSTNYHSMSVMP